MPDPRLDADWVRALCAAQGAPCAPAEAAELARTLERLLAALDELAPRRRFEDEPAGFARALAAHRERKRP